MIRDYRRISYYIDPMGQIWHGPFCPYDNVHYKLVEKEAVSHSNLPDYCVQITAWQAAQYLQLKDYLIQMVSKPKRK